MKTLLAGSLIAVVGSCTDAPTAVIRPEDEPISTLTPPEELGSPQSIALPLDNHPDNGVGGVWYSQFTTPSAGYYLIRVAGTVLHTYNPECDPPSYNIDCDSSLDNAQHGPLDSGGAGRITVGYTTAGATLSSGQSPSLESLRPHPTAEAVGIVLTYYGAPRTIWTRRTVAVGCKRTIFSHCAEDRQPQYFLSGSNSITVAHVATPAGVQGPATIAPLFPAAFTGLIVEDLPPDLDAGGNPRVSWSYRSGDSLSTPGGGAAQQIHSCTGSINCSYTPPATAKSGRMQFTVYVHGRRLTGYSGVIRVRNPELELTCPGSAVRGEKISCTAVANPSVPLTDIHWRFTPDPTVIHPKAAPIGMAEDVTESTSGPVWEGQLVLSGRVTVRANLGSKVDSAVANVTVTERSWNVVTGSAPSRVNYDWGLEPYFDKDVNEYGENVHIAADGTTHGGVALLGFHLGGGTPVPAEHFRTVPSGPNRGYQYVEVYEIRLSRGYQLNKFITPAGPPDIVTSEGGLQNRWNALITGGWGDPAAFLERATQHETSGAGHIGHHDGLVQASTGEVCGNVARRIERVAGSAERVEAELVRISVSAVEFHAIGTHHHRVHGHLQDARFVLRMEASPAPIPVELNDPQFPLPDIEYRSICEYEGWGL